MVRFASEPGESPQRAETAGRGRCRDLSAAAWALAGLTALADAPAMAQRIPGTVGPGRPAPTAPPLPRAPIELDWTVVLPGGAEVPDSLAQEPIDFADLRVTGATVYDPADFVEIYAADRGREITFGRLYDYARAIQARYGMAGLNMVSQDQFDIVLCDLSMEPINGMRFVEFLRKHKNAKLRDLPVIILTMHNEQEIVKKVIEQGIDGYLLKPVSIKSIKERIEQVLGGESSARPAIA